MAFVALLFSEVHMDKRFLDKFCPRFTGHMHYRLVDVSTIKDLMLKP